MQKNVCYHTAIYLRLSREDGEETLNDRLKQYISKIAETKY